MSSKFDSLQHRERSDGDGSAQDQLIQRTAVVSVQFWTFWLRVILTSTIKPLCVDIWVVWTLWALRRLVDQLIWRHVEQQWWTWPAEHQHADIVIASVLARTTPLCLTVTSQRRYRGGLSVLRQNIKHVSPHLHRTNLTAGYLLIRPTQPMFPLCRR